MGGWFSAVLTALRKWMCDVFSYGAVVAAAKPPVLYMLRCQTLTRLRLFITFNQTIGWQ
jgi:hypothetical protein